MESIKWIEKRLEQVDRIVRAIERAVADYLQWMGSVGYSRQTQQNYNRQINQFVRFVKHRRFVWNDIFTMATLKLFQKSRGIKHVHAVIGLSRYLFKQKRIHSPIGEKQPPLPEVYQSYLNYYAQSAQTSRTQTGTAKRVLLALSNYLERSHIKLKTVKIEHIDAFLAEFNAPFAPATRRLYRTYLRRFLTYLYHQGGILKRDLAPLVVGPPLYAQAKPPKFLRPGEIKQLFDTAQFATACELRTYAMLHLAYTLGLRPMEISLITLDDISFSTGQISIKDRKSNRPIKLPLPEQTLKAIAAYLVGARADSTCRTLFLNITAPYIPVTATTVSRYISALMRAAGLKSTAYWLRHTYTQNLLESGVSIFEIKEMMGHDRIQSTKRYLSIHIKMMREVLFDETL